MRLNPFFIRSYIQMALADNSLYGKAVLIPSLSGHIFKSNGDSMSKPNKGLNPFFIRSYIQIDKGRVVIFKEES